MTVPLLRAQGISKRFGGVIANDRVDLDVHEGEIVGLIGPNGAGKTTLFNMLGGVRPAGSRPFPNAGTVRFDGHDVTRLPAHRICHLGIGRAFQIVQIFDDMSVLMNVSVGAMVRAASMSEAEERALDVLHVVGMQSKAGTLGSDLTIAERKKLEVARALATDPKLLMLDEVMAGLTPREVNEAVDLVKRINERGVTVLLVEHVLEAVMSACSRVVVLHQGRKIADAAPSDVVRDPAVVDAYLGGGHA